MKWKSDKYFRNVVLFSVLLISLLMHFPHFSKELMSNHSWRQTQTQSTIISFYEEDMNILHPRRNDRGDTDGIFRMEFPLMQWLVACCYKIFGNHLVITRIFMFVIGLFSILGMYQLLLAVFHNETLSLIGAWAFNFSPSFFYYTINPLPDNMALCCSVWGIALFFKWYQSSSIKHLLGSGVLLSIGALTKLPFIVYYIVPLLHFLTTIVLKRKTSKKTAIEALGILGFSILPILWYFSVMPEWGSNVVKKGVLAGHEPLSAVLNYILYNLTSVLPEMLLNYGSVVFFLAGFYFLFRRKAHSDPRFPLFLAWSIAVAVYYLFEANAIAKVHDYYLFPFYPLLFILVAYGASCLFELRLGIARYMTYFLLLVLPVICFFRMQDRWNPDAPHFNKDLLTFKNELRNAVPKNSLVVAGNDVSHFIFFYYIDKKGWGYDSDYLTVQELKIMIEKGAEYLYTDSGNIDGNAEIASCLDKLILEKGSIRVYRLKR
jgi:hypothetical protein